MNYYFHLGDCRDMLHSLQEPVQLVLTSPPYNIGKDYEESLSMEEYRQQQAEIIHLCYEKLSPNGSLCWQVGHTVIGSGKSKQVVPLDIFLAPIFFDLGMKLKNRIVWTFGHGLHDSYRFSGRHESILWFTKGDDYTFDLDAVRVPQKYPNKKHFQGPRKGKLSGNPLGKNPGDVWDMPQVKANHVEKTDHPCQFPVGLAMRLILALTREGDTVMDPFMGSGTVAVACQLTNRKFVGAEIREDYLQIALERVQGIETGETRVREMNKPVYDPTIP